MLHLIGILAVVYTLCSKVSGCDFRFPLLSKVEMYWFVKFHSCRSIAPSCLSIFPEIETKAKLSSEICSSNWVHYAVAWLERLKITKTRVTLRTRLNAIARNTEFSDSPAVQISHRPAVKVSCTGLAIGCVPHSTARRKVYPDIHTHELETPVGREAVSRICNINSEQLHTG